MESTNSANETQMLTSDDKQMIKEAICSLTQGSICTLDIMPVANSLIEAFKVVNKS